MSSSKAPAFFKTVYRYSNAELRGILQNSPSVMARNTFSAMVINKVMNAKTSPQTLPMSSDGATYQPKTVKLVAKLTSAADYNISKEERLQAKIASPQASAEKTQKRQQKLHTLQENTEQINAVKKAVIAAVHCGEITNSADSEELSRQGHNAYVEASKKVFSEDTVNEALLKISDPERHSVYRFGTTPTSTVTALHFLKRNLLKNQILQSSDPRSRLNAFNHTAHVYKNIMNNWEGYDFLNNLDTLLDMTVTGGDPRILDMMRITIALLRSGQDPATGNQLDQLLATRLDGGTTLEMLLDPNNPQYRETFGQRTNNVADQNAPLSPQQQLQRQAAVLKLQRSMLCLQKLLLQSIQSMPAQAATTSSADAPDQQPPSSRGPAGPLPSTDRGRSRDRSGDVTGTGGDGAPTTSDTRRGRSNTRRSAAESAEQQKSHSSVKDMFLRVVTFNQYKRRSRSVDIVTPDTTSRTTPAASRRSSLGSQTGAPTSHASAPSSVGRASPANTQNAAASTSTATQQPSIPTQTSQTPIPTPRARTQFNTTNTTQSANGQAQTESANNPEQQQDEDTN